MKNLKFKYVLKSKKLLVLVMSVAISASFSFTKANAAASTDRYSGINRYETAAKVCEDGWKASSDYAVIVNGENFPDSLSAAPLARKYDAPILLTGADALSPYTSSELNRLNVKNVIIIGGKGVVHQTIEDALKARGIKVTRIGGADRYETALQVAGKLGKSTEIALVNGTNFHDGISIASIAATKGMPIILTNKDSMPSSVKKYLQANKKADQIYVVGGTDRISNNDISDLTNVKRIGSGDNYEMNTSIIKAFQNEISTGTLYIASAKDFPDSLGASAIAPKTSSPVLFVDSPMSEATQEFLKTNIVNNIKVLGGTGAVSYETEQISGTLPLDVSQTSNLSDTIWQNEKYTPRRTLIITASDGNKKEVPVTWNLTKINTTKPGIYTFNGTIAGTDKSVVNTLIVKPLPYKISDIITTTGNKAIYSPPSTVTAQMTDGTFSNVAVTWDYGTQDGNKPGTYVFYGTVDKYSKKVKLTVNIKNDSNIKNVNNIKIIVNTQSEFVLPTTVVANMDDNTTKNVQVVWGSKQAYPNYVGVYTYEGTVSGYNGTVRLLLIVKDENGVDPNDPNYDDNSSDVIATIDPVEVPQGDPYRLPTTVKDPDTGKSLPVSWTTTNVNTNGVDNPDLEKCSVSTITLEGTLTGSKNKVKINVIIRPKIKSIYPEDTQITITRDDYLGKTYEMPSTIRVVTTDGSIKNAKILKWDPPYADLGDPQTYYVNGTIKNYSRQVTITLKVTK